MKATPRKFETLIGGRTLSVEFNDLAARAHGSCLLRYGNTVLLATAVMGREEKPNVDFVPLTVDYEEKFYAAGAIPGSRYLRREGRPSENAILSARLIDRAIRPLFPKHLRREVQVVITVLAIDEEEPDALAVSAASLALGTSRIPWSGPVSAVRVAQRESASDFLINPRLSEREGSFLDLLACGNDERIVMLEAEGIEAPEEIVEKALERALGEIALLQEFQTQIIGEVGTGKEAPPAKGEPSSLVELFDASARERLEHALFAPDTDLDALAREWTAEAVEKNRALPGESRAIFESAARELVRQAALDGRRLDGRAPEEIRALHASAGDVSPALHGSGTFFRGDTHVLSVLTLGGPAETLLVDTPEMRNSQRRFMHHYNFPPFSVGEPGRVGSTNRRMVGHGALAEKALQPIIPPRDKFPYTIRLVSECFSSDGSTSMASVCASTLALMDGGVPVARPVAGIALGLVEEGDRKVLLTDIAGAEDRWGDMDFKIAGTERGITALQLDVKNSGISRTVLAEALARGKSARSEVLAALSGALAAPRERVSSRAPHVLTRKIENGQIGLVIGAGGKTIREMEKVSGAEISVEDDGIVFIVGRNGAAESALALLDELLHEYARGERFSGTVVKATDFGAFVRIGFNTEGLLHISEMKNKLAIGDMADVAVKDVDERGRISLAL